VAAFEALPHASLRRRSPGCTRPVS